MANDFSGDNNCQAVYNFESGAITTDSSGNGNTLTDHNTVGTDAADYKQGSACATFDNASTEYLDITDASLSADFPFKSSDTTLLFSWCGWRKFNSTDTQAVIGKWRGGTGGRVILVRLTSSHVVLYTGYSSGNETQSDTHATVLSTGLWYHIAVTVNANTGAYRIRVENEAGNLGSTDKTGTFSNTIYTSGTEPWQIGAQESGTTLDGKADEDVFFNKILSVDEIDDIRNATFGSSGVLPINLSTSWELATQKNNNTSWKILDLLSRNTSYKILNTSIKEVLWKILDLKDQDTEWKVLFEDNKSVAWNILTSSLKSTLWKILDENNSTTSWKLFREDQNSTSWDVLTSLTGTHSWRILNSIIENIIWRIKNLKDQDIEWQILTSGGISQNISWKILKDIVKEYSWRITTLNDSDISWSILNSIVEDCSWKLKALLEDDTSWRIQETNSFDIAWQILGLSKIDKNISWRILSVKDSEVDWRILSDTSNSTQWKVFNEDSNSTSWNVLKITDRDLAYGLFNELLRDTSWSIDGAITSPSAVYEFFQQKRNFIFIVEKRS